MQEVQGASRFHQALILCGLRAHEVLRGPSSSAAAEGVDHRAAGDRDHEDRGAQCPELEAPGRKLLPVEEDVEGERPGNRPRLGRSAARGPGEVRFAAPAWKI